jgi:hypothetical protein
MLQRQSSENSSDVVRANWYNTNIYPRLTARGSSHIEVLSVQMFPSNCLNPQLPQDMTMALVHFRRIRTVSITEADQQESTIWEHTRSFH